MSTINKASDFKKNNANYDAIIVGAGVIGSALALGLAKQKNWKVALIEKNTPISINDKPQNLRATALGLPSQALLEELNVWQELKIEQYSAYEHMFVWDENSDSELSFSAHDYAKDALGFIVDHFALQACLQAAIKETELIECFYNTEILEINSLETFTQVQIQGEQSNLSTQWVFAADGVNSSIRSMAGIAISQHDYHQQGIVAKIRTQSPHQNTAWQRYLSSGSLALLPLYSGESSIVWSVTTNEASELCELSEPVFNQRLECALQSRFGTIELCSQRHSFALQSVRAEHYLKNSVVLIGDAAHGIHPMAGQGANLGFSDVASLLQEIGNLTAKDNKMYRSLRRYERQQKLHNQTMDGFLTGLDSLFRNDNVFTNSLRSIGLQTVNKNPLLKSFFAQRVLSKS